MPQPGPQTEAIAQHGIDELFYGGAVGGGKSDYLLGDFAQDVPNYGSAWRGILFRRTYGELEELIARSQEIYPLWFPGVEYYRGDKEWIWPNGAILRMRYMEHSSDWMRYWGHQYTWMGWDELPTWPDLDAYQKMKTRLRSAADIPNKRIRATGNPGGPGHQAVKAYWQIGKYPQGGEVLSDPDTGGSRLFIRARVTDNQILLKNDPNYPQRLRGLGSRELVRAWLEGDWGVVFGAYFDCWDTDKHVIRPCKLPDHWMRFRSMDWGSYRPFSVGWWAHATEDFEHADGIIPKRSLVRYREWYGATEPNKGLKLPAEEVAKGILEREEGDDISYGVLDPSAFASDGGPSLAERIHRVGVNFRRADNRRVPDGGHMGGWDQLRSRMIGEGGKPLIYTFSTCTDSIRTIPALQHDDRRPEDVDTEQEDHAADEWRYAAMSRPYIRPAAVDEPFEINTTKPTLNDLMKAADKEERRTRRI